MAKNMVQEGEVITITGFNHPALLSGAPVMVGGLFGVLQIDSPLNAELVMDTEHVYDLPKVAAQVWTVGQRIFFDSATGLVSNATAAGTFIIGCATEARANPSATGRVRLDGVSVAAV